MLLGEQSVPKPDGVGSNPTGLAFVLAGQPGQATVNGLDPSIPEHRRKLPEVVGVVFQNPDDQLFSPTVEEDVAFGPLNLGATVDEAKARVAEGEVKVNGKVELRKTCKIRAGQTVVIDDTTIKVLNPK